MLKFIKHHMESITGIELFPLISFVIFFTFFIAMAFYVASFKKKEIEEFENIPLDHKN
jgi:cytochrome c oxidase cbb3-type subunit IV